MSTSPAGKGDKPRPKSCSEKEYADRYDSISWTKKTTAKAVVSKKGKTTYKY